jgi:hypothetical protein
LKRLFVIVLLIRILLNKWSPRFFLPGNAEQFHANCGFSFNTPFSFYPITSVKQFLDSIVEPKSFPHIAVYTPPSAGFELYDVIVAAFDADKSCHLIGYQIKAGNDLPSNSANFWFEHSIVIRGKFDGNSAPAPNGWTVADEKRIDDFFGHSGANWTPKCWLELNSAEREATEPGSPQQRRKEKGQVAKRKATELNLRSNDAKKKAN